MLVNAGVEGQHHESTSPLQQHQVPRNMGLRIDGHHSSSRRLCPDDVRVAAVTALRFVPRDFHDSRHLERLSTRSSHPGKSLSIDKRSLIASPYLNCERNRKLPHLAMAIASRMLLPVESWQPSVLAFSVSVNAFQVASLCSFLFVEPLGPPAFHTEG